MTTTNRKISPAVVYKSPPASEEFERTILGTCIINKDAYEIASDIIKKDDIFYFEKHQQIFTAMREMFTARKPIDIITLAEHLKVKGLLEQIGRHYLTTLTNDVVSSVHLEQHCLKIKEHYIARRLIVYGQEVSSRAYAGEDCFETANDHIKKVEEIINMGSSEQDPSMVEGLYTFIKEYGEGMQHSDQLSGIPSGFHKLDQLTNGWQDTDLIILAARPSVGKTAFALNMALNAAMHKINPSPVGIFSMEMSKKKLVERMVSTLTEVNIDMIRKRNMSMEQFDDLQARLSNEKEIPIYIDDTAALNWLELRIRARRMKRLYGIKLFIIDYLQLMSDVYDGEKRNKEQQVSRISKEIKRLAKELQVPIIALSQLSREVEKRGEAHKMPQLSDLRDSGALEQDADVVVFIYRPEYHNIQTNEHGESTINATEIRIAKHRNGELDTIRFVAHLSIQKFVEATTYPTEARVQESGSKGFHMWQPIGE